jgi:hypothetical protein
MDSGEIPEDLEVFKEVKELSSVNTIVLFNTLAIG